MAEAPVGAVWLVVVYYVDAEFRGHGTIRGVYTNEIHARDARYRLEQELLEVEGYPSVEVIKLEVMGSGELYPYYEGVTL